ncbi:MAG: flagellar hook assembly protein FlgD [Myxococcaceae bacterium]|nr:flagellar hook assembly protein FlgD [Myxococcaceae bacterium]
MAVSNVSSTSSSDGAAPSAPPKSALGKDDFLKLLMSQLGNQDPLSPMDSQAFVAQLAQFSNVEQQQQQGARLDALLMAQTSNNQLQAASLVGKDAIYRTDGVDAAGGPVPLSAQLSGDAATVTATIKDSAGRTVRTLTLGNHAQGALESTWDGRDASGAMVPAGHYTVTFTAADTAGHSVDCSSQGKSRITGVSFESGYAELLLQNGQRIKLADVTALKEASSPAASAAASAAASPTPLSSAELTALLESIRHPTL